MNTTKTIHVTANGIYKGDVIVATGLCSSPQGEGINVKPLRDPITALGRYRVTRTREFVTLADGTEKSFPMDTLYRVHRELTAAEMEEQAGVYAAKAAEDVHRRILDPASGVRAARDKLVNALQTNYATDPVGALRWMSDSIAEAQGLAACWGTVARIASHLANVDTAEDSDRFDPTDADVLRAVLLTLRGVEAELLRGDYARSTNPYGNALEDDTRKAQAAWRRDYTVLHAVRAAKHLGITVEDDE